MTKDALSAFSDARKRLGMSRRRLAIALGMSQTTIGHYEHGRHPVPIVVALAMRALWHRLEDPLISPST